MTATELDNGVDHFRLGLLFAVVLGVHFRHRPARSPRR